MKRLFLMAIGILGGMNFVVTQVQAQTVSVNESLPLETSFVDELSPPPPDPWWYLVVFYGPWLLPLAYLALIIVAAKQSKGLVWKREMFYFVALLVIFLLDLLLSWRLPYLVPGTIYVFQYWLSRVILVFLVGIGAIVNYRLHINNGQLLPAGKLNPWLTVLRLILLGMLVLWFFNR